MGRDKLDSSETPAFVKTNDSNLNLYERFVYRRERPFGACSDTPGGDCSAFNVTLLPGTPFESTVENPDCFSAFFAWSSTCSNVPTFVPVERDGGGRPADRPDEDGRGALAVRLRARPPRLKPFEANPANFTDGYYPDGKEYTTVAQCVSDYLCDPDRDCALAVQFDEELPECPSACELAEKNPEITDLACSAWDILGLLGGTPFPNPTAAAITAAPGTSSTSRPR